MADRSTIEWTDATWNPLAAFDRVTGRRGWFCVKVSEGCRNCYAESFNKFRGNSYEYTAQNRSNVRFELVNLDQPFRWKRPRRIFVNSMTDLFGDFVSDEDIAEIFKMMYKSPRHTFQILTKRPERMLDWISRSAFLSNAPLTNAWLGVSVEDQATADQRIPLLIETPAAVRWISAEPLLGSISLAQYYREEGQGTYSTWLNYLNWVVVGGESGPGARPMNPYWARQLRNQCFASDVRFLFKQWGEFTPLFGCDDPCGRCVQALPDGSITGFDWQSGPHLSHEALQLHRVGKKKAGRQLFGREWNEYPSIAEGNA